MNNKLKIIIIFIFLFGIVFSLFKIITWKIDNDENEMIQEKTKKLIIDENKDKVKEENKNESLEEKYNIDFKKLKEQNTDTIAYLKVNGTDIDYIVVKGKDNDYYLHHNFEKKYNIAGWVFADYHNKYDNQDKNLVIYGHNMQNGSMFGTLKNILNEEWYSNEDNHKIVLVTESGTYIYKVFSTYSIKPENYYIKTDFNSDDEYNEFISILKSRSIYNYDTDLNDTAQILTLSSCTARGTKRVVLHARLISKI